MARQANPVAPVLPPNPTPDRITERVAALEVTAEVITDVGADGTVLTSDGTDFGWEAIPA